MPRNHRFLLRVLAAALAAAALGVAQDVPGVAKLFEAGRFIEAWQQAQQMAAREPSNAEAHYWVGWTAFRCGALEESETALTRALALRPAYPAAALVMGRRFESDERTAKAIEWYEKAWQLDPRQTEPLLRIAQIYKDNGAWARSAEYYRRAQALGAGPGVADVLGAARRAEKEQAGGVVSAETFRSLSRGVRAPANKSTGAPAAPEPARMAFKISFSRDKFAVEDLPPIARAQLNEVATALLSPE